MANKEERCSLQDILDFGNNDDEFFRINLQTNVQNLQQICRQVTEMARHQAKQTENRTYLKHDEVERVKEFHKQSTEYLLTVAKMLKEKRDHNQHITELNDAKRFKSEALRLLNTAKAELKVTDDVYKALEKLKQEWEMLDLD